MQPTAATAVFRNNIFNLVLGGGGINSMAHVGLLRASHERGVNWGQVFTVSGGSLVGGIWKNGYAISDLPQILLAELDHFGRSTFSAIFKPSGIWRIMRYGGAVDLRPIIDSMVDRLHLRPQPDLNIVASYRNTDGCIGPYVFNGPDYDLRTALNATCAMPPYIRPVNVISGEQSLRLFDGGVWHPAPHQLCHGPAIISRINMASKFPRRRMSITDRVIHLTEMVARPFADRRWTNSTDPLHITVLAGRPDVATFAFGVSDQMVDAMIRYGYEQANRSFDMLERRHPSGVLG